MVSGRSQPDNVVLRDETYFHDNAIDFVPGATVVSVDPAQSSLRLASGETWHYDRLLIATGAAPVLPPVARPRPMCRFTCCGRWMTPSICAQAIGQAKSAIVLGAGLIGMHAAENMAKAKIAVTVVELQPHALSAISSPAPRRSSSERSPATASAC